MVLFDACFAAPYDPYHVFERPDKTIAEEGKSCVPPTSNVLGGESTDTEEPLDDCGVFYTTCPCLRMPTGCGLQVSCLIILEGARFGPWWALRPNMIIPWNLNINASSPIFFGKVFESKTYKDSMDNHLKRGKYGLCKIQEIPGLFPGSSGWLGRYDTNTRPSMTKLMNLYAMGFLRRSQMRGLGGVPVPFRCPRQTANGVLS